MLSVIFYSCSFEEHCDIISNIPGNFLTQTHQEDIRRKYDMFWVSCERGKGKNTAETCAIFQTPCSPHVFAANIARTYATFSPSPCPKHATETLQEIDICFRDACQQNRLETRQKSFHTFAAWTCRVSDIKCQDHIFISCHVLGMFSPETWTIAPCECV